MRGGRISPSDPCPCAQNRAIVPWNTASLAQLKLDEAKAALTTDTCFAPNLREKQGADSRRLQPYERKARTRNVSLTYMARVALGRGPSTAIELQSNSSAWPGGPR
jgi:hypothetical protein